MTRFFGLLAVFLALAIAGSAIYAESPATRPSISPTTAPTTAPATAPAVANGPAAKFAGEYNTSYGPMRLRQTGADTLEGRYGQTGENIIRGAVNPRGRFVFEYIEPNATGEGYFEITDQGEVLVGKWREKHAEQWAGWHARRTHAAPETESFSGLWQTSYGRVRLTQSDKNLTGIFEFGGRSRITGTIEGRKATFSYVQGDGERGSGVFELAADGQSFTGIWKGGKDDATRTGEWTGQRVLKQDGRVWLVVLEAPWEQNLADNEYSFGQMLRTYFSRLPNVAVRQRALNSEADLRRWTSELPYFAEPVVLYIASHGTEKGISVGNSTVNAATIADCIKDADNLMLLHFGSCLVGAGEVPRDIYKAIGPSAKFPISGYTKAADWGGSAVIDFTYLDLVFGRGLKPVEAVRQTRRMITFAADADPAGAPIRPAGLVVFEP